MYGTRDGYLMGEADGEVEHVDGCATGDTIVLDVRDLSIGDVSRSVTALGFVWRNARHG